MAVPVELEGAEPSRIGHVEVAFFVKSDVGRQNQPSGGIALLPEPVEDVAALFIEDNDLSVLYVRHIEFIVIGDGIHGLPVAGKAEGRNVKIIFVEDHNLAAHGIGHELAAFRVDADVDGLRELPSPWAPWSSSKVFFSRSKTMTVWFVSQT